MNNRVRTLQSLLVKRGQVGIWIDGIVSCLKDTSTGFLVDTVAFPVKDKNILKNFNKGNGWHVSWSTFPECIEVYAVALKQNHEIQGLVALRNDTFANSAYIQWACVAPRNNKHDSGTQKYVGVGAHLFAVAVDKSIQWGHDGYVYGYASNMEVLHHYMKMFHAEHIGILHKYHFIINEENAKKILEEHSYEWRTDIAKIS